MRFSIKTREVRIQKGYTQEECAIKSDLSIRYYQRIESGEKIPSIEVLSRIAKVLGVSTGSLIVDELRN